MKTGMSQPSTPVYFKSMAGMLQDPATKGNTALKMQHSEQDQPMHKMPHGWSQKWHACVYKSRTLNPAAVSCSCWASAHVQLAYSPSLQGIKTESMQQGQHKGPSRPCSQTTPTQLPYIGPACKQVAPTSPNRHPKAHTLIQPKIQSSGTRPCSHCKHQRT